MGWLKWIRIVCILFWSICTLITILVLFTEITFTSNVSNLIFIFTTTCGLPLILFLTATESKHKRSLAIWFISLTAATAIIYKSIDFISFGSGFKTQTITHRNLNDPRKRIEFQMEDIGALGYNRRTVIVTPICGFLQQEKEINPDKFNYSNWKQVDEEINELGIKFP